MADPKDSSSGGGGGQSETPKPETPKPEPPKGPPITVVKGGRVPGEQLRSSHDSGGGAKSKK